MPRFCSTLKLAVLTASFALLPCAAVSASAQSTARVEVPFPFLANHVSLPAGHYEVISSDTSLILYDASTRRAQAILAVRHEIGYSPETRARMTFEKSGTHLVLTDVRFAGSAMHSVLLVQPKRERVVAQGPKANDVTIELAMK